MKKILIAEDDFTSRRFMQKLMSKYGDCYMAADGLEAIQMYRESLEEKEYFDFLILDIMMPNIDGLSVLRMIREMDTEARGEEYITPAVFLTALRDENVLKISKDLNAELFNKPLSVDTFFSYIETKL